MQNINATKRLAQLELKEGLDGNRSWHHQYKDSAYIFVGGLHLGLTEGDVVIMFSQFGEIVDVNLVRDKQTGKSKGFAFICYEDQRSTILAVDNMNGYTLLHRNLRVDHVDKYKAPKQFDENDKDEEGDPKLLEYKATGAEGKGHQVYNVLDSQQKFADIQEEKKNRATQKVLEDEDEAWAKEFEDNLKGLGDMPSFKQLGEKKKLQDAKKELKRMKKEAKKLKKEAKKAKKAKKAKREAKAAEKGTKAKKSSSSSSSDSSG